MRLSIAFVALLLSLSINASADPISITGPDLPGLEQTLFGSPQTDVSALEEAGVSFTVTSKGDYTVEIDFTAQQPGEVTWPVIPSDERIEGWILPLAEGNYVPADDIEWIDDLVEREVNTIETLSMPFIALDMDGYTVTFIFGNPLENEVIFENQDGRLAAHVTHTFRANWDVHEYPVTVVTGPDNPIAPAHIYRAWMKEHGEFVSMAEKIEATPNAERLLGAAHAYLWSGGVIAREDVKGRDAWRSLGRRLSEAEEGTPERRIFDAFANTDQSEAQSIARGLPTTEWVDRYQQGVIASALSQVLNNDDLFTREQLAEHCAPEALAALENIPSTEGLSRWEVVPSPYLAANTEVFASVFKDEVNDPSTWGAGNSTRMIDALHEAGIGRMVLCLGDWSDILTRPQVADRADEVGYLFGPYDSYHSMHSPSANENSTWPTAQFDQETWETAGVMRADGSYGGGFMGRGRHTNSEMINPWVTRRLNHAAQYIDYNAWFVDCDAYGQFFNNFSPEHPSNRLDDMNARLERLQTIVDDFDMVVGSEGGSAYSSRVIHWGEGIVTPVIGWGDPLMTDRNSEYYQGGYWPPDEPTGFFMSIPMQDKYTRPHFDPRFRLPLYEAALHDSTVVTHHWGGGSLRYRDHMQTTALIELLYQVPPMFHLNLNVFRNDRRDYIVEQSQAFERLHRITGLLPMTGFDWLTDDRLVQRTDFGEGQVTITANFREEPVEIDGVSIPAQSIRATGTALDEPMTVTPNPR